MSAGAGAGSSREGPALEVLTRRLQDAPGEILGEPALGGRAGVNVAAVISDLFVGYGAAPMQPETATMFRPVDAPANRNWLRLLLVGAWLLRDPWFAAHPNVDGAWRFFSSGLTDLAATVPADVFVTDADRREELARRCLAALDLVPAGETSAQAADRLTTLDSVERARVLAATAYAEQRAAAVREAMHQKAAAEAAAKATRE